VNRRLLVDLEALAANYRVFQAACSSPGQTLGGVVKANAYGTGADLVLARLQDLGCSSFFVATLDEALALRHLLVPGDRLYVFEGVDEHGAAEFAASGLIPVLNDPAQLAAWRPFADKPAALHFDTGMSRLGFHRDTDPGAFAGLNIALVMTHLACADTPEHPLNDAQRKRFERIAAGFPGIPTSIGNSAGWLSAPSLQGDLGRPGIGLYGGNPFVDRPSPVLPVASLQGRVLQLKSLSSGESAGYGATWVAERDTMLAAVGLGYADGLPRHLSGVGEMALLAGGHRCPIIGRISMDTTMIDVSNAPEVRPGDWVEGYGVHIGIDEVAARAGTLSYELLTAVSARGPRVVGALG
jgi:alanine racemase